MLRTIFLSALALLSAQPVFGYALEGQTWTLNRSVQVQLSLHYAPPKSGQFPSFDASAADALSKWNPHLEHLTLVPVLHSTVTPTLGDDENSVSFSNSVFGSSFGANVIAATVVHYRGDIFEESDTVFNTAYQWDSYDGPLGPVGPDFHRTALHEFGHLLGLDHPDEHGQTLNAIMNSNISDLYRLQPDDVAGVKSLYQDGPAEESAVAAPVLANISTRAQVGFGDNVLIGGFIIQGTAPATVVLRAIGFSLDAQAVLNALPDPILTVYDSSGGQIAMNDDWFVGPKAAAIASYHLDPPNSRESALLLTLNPGAYTAIISSFDSNDKGPPPIGIALFELYDLHTTDGRAGNISTRGQVLADDKVLIGGFIVGGSESKPVVLRAIGPSLGGAGVANALADPFLELHDGNGDLLQSNDDWAKGPDAHAIASEGFAPSNAKESALQATLNPGNYTAIVRGVNGATGIGLVEVYDMSAVP